MLQRRTRLLAACLAAAIAAALAPGAASAATINACVKSKTGDVRIVSAKRKCAKGWKRVRWNTTSPRTGPAGKQGPQGIQGPQGLTGPNLTVKDATGATVGRFLGLVPTSGALYVVERDGGQYYYLGSGQLYPIANPSYKASDCSGTAYVKNSSSTFSTATFVALIGGPFRVTFRAISAGVFGPSSAWQGTSVTETLGIPTQLYRRNTTTGVCETDGSPTTGVIVALAPVAAPPDFTGPLTIG